MIRTADLADFLRSRGITDEITFEEYLPDMPDRIVRLNVTGGPGTSHERAFDRAAVQVLVRGDQGHPSASYAEDLATDVDRALLDAPFPVRIGGRYVMRVDYLGALPAVVGRDGDRTVMACSYLFEITRD